jgi:hypothetical protein
LAVIRDPAERRLRALMMLEYRIKNAASLEQIAKEFNVAPKTVQKNLTWARRAGLVADAEDKILQELVPAAHEALKKALTVGDAETAGRLAIEVFKGTISGFKKTPHTTVSDTGGDDLGTYLAQLRADNSNANAIDGELVEGTAQRALPAGPEASVEKGNLPSTVLPAPGKLDE